jgi:hypothetical protein
MAQFGIKRVAIGENANFGGNIPESESSTLRRLRVAIEVKDGRGTQRW